MFPVREQLIPNLGTFHSQLGNISFPSWEYTSNQCLRSVEFLDKLSGKAEFKFNRTEKRGCGLFSCY